MVIHDRLHRISKCVVRHASSGFPTNRGGGVVVTHTHTQFGGIR